MARLPHRKARQTYCPSIRITFSLVSGLVGTGGLGDGAYLPAAAFPGIDLTLAVVAGGMSGSVGQPRVSCTEGACQRCRACRAAGQRRLGRGCPRESRPGPPRRRRSHRPRQVRVRSSRPGQRVSRWQAARCRDRENAAYLDEVLALGLGDERL